MSFSMPYLLALILLAPVLLWLRRRRQEALGHSQVEIHQNLRSVPILGWIPPVLFVLAWAALCIALARPLLPEVTEKKTIQTRDFVVVTDISGSMFSAIQDPAQKQFAGNQPGADPEQPRQQLRRIDVAQEAIKVFVERRNGDRVALLVFDDNTYYHWPLTDDLTIISEKGQLLNKQSGGGTNFDGPNGWQQGIGPLQAAIDHFKEMGKAKTKILVMVTDGESNINDQRFVELAEAMELLGVRIYVLGVGESWVNSGSMTQDLRRFVTRLDGTVIPVGDAEEMRKGFATIDQMEVSKVELEKAVSFKEIYHWFLLGSLGLWLLYLASTAITHEDA